MINRHELGRHIVRIAASAGIAVGVLALTIAARPVAAQQPAAVRTPVSALERYVGEWVYPDGNTVTIQLRGETLFREIPGQRIPFVPISDTLFRFGPVFTAEFLTDSAGGITQIISDGAGTEYRLHRKGSRPAKLPPPPAEVPVPKSVLERYVGTYDYIPGQMKRTDLIIVVRLRGDRLTRQIGRAEQVLTPVSETRFRVGDTSLMVEFVIDGAGVTQVLGSGFQQMLARRRPNG